MDNYTFVLYFGILLIGLSNTQFIEGQGRINNTLRTIRQSSFKCTLPRHPVNGHWVIINGEKKPGEEIEANSVLRLDCKPEYRLHPNNSIIACDSNWDPANFPKCKKKCPAFYSTVTTKIKCMDEDGNKIECDQAIHGTYLTFDCIAYYEVPSGAKSTLYCREGTWDFPKPICQPVCGKKFNNETTALSWGGREVIELEYPWAVAVYLKLKESFKNICGATLVSRRVVITAAHCVTDDYGNTLKQEDFKIAAGKFYNALDDPRDKWAQIRELSKLIVHDSYRGASKRFAADIALLVTKQLFQLGPVVQPVCINNINDVHLSSYQVGEVAGWGLTQNNVAADRLRVIKVPYKDGDTCTEELPPDWEVNYNFFDKICAGHFKKNISVCLGDSGSGLIFLNRADNRYYIHGLVSVAPKLSHSQCNYETNALYTSISFYHGYIDREMAKNYEEDCELPQHPRNGRWQIDNDAEKKPKDIVPSTTILKFFCNRGYMLSSGGAYYECENSYNTPTCNLLCPQLEFPANTIVICKNRREETIDCRQAVEGSSITFTCPNGFISDTRRRTSTRYCIGGSYGTSRPNCFHRKIVKPKTTQASKASNSLKVICTYASWSAYNGVGPEDFDANLCTHIEYQFIGLWDTGDLRVQDANLDLDHVERGLFNRVVDLKKKNPDLKVMLSVGGTAASNSSIFRRVASDVNKTAAFLSSVSNILKTYHFDGINIDWKTPGVYDQGFYISFLETIKEEFNKNGWLLSASVLPDFSRSGYNPKEMNRILDWVTIETLDFYGSWSPYTGNHNQLYASSKENDWEKQHLNVDAEAKNWLTAGLTKEKMVLTVAFHGRSFTLADKDDHGIHAIINGTGPGIDDGFLRYYEICSEYIYGFKEIWDDETKTDYKYSNKFWIGFNSEDAVRIKGEYIKKNGYAGVNVYPIDGDDNKGVCGQKHVLLKYLHVGLGHPVLLQHKGVY